MKTSHLGLGLTLALLVSGCTYEPEVVQLQNQNIQQANQIMQQQIQIDALREQIAIQRSIPKKFTPIRRKRRNITKKVLPKIKNNVKNNVKNDIQNNVKDKIKNNIPTPIKNASKKLKKVEDKNYSSEYMYPVTDTVSRAKNKIIETPKSTTPKATIGKMTKSECISMIGQKKFDTYTKVFGGEEASIKRCKMIRVMQK